LREIDGFDYCLSDSIEIPASVEIIRGFGNSQLSHLRFAEGTKIKIIQGVFVSYDETDLRKSRPRLDMISRQVYGH
jgi:hypothetical protein